MNKEGTQPQRTLENMKARAVFWNLGVDCLTLSFTHSTLSISGSFQEKGENNQF